MSEFAALDRQVSEAKKNEEFIRKNEGKTVWMDEVNEARRNEQELVGKINQAGASYQKDFEKQAGGKAFERDADGKITGLDFGKADDIYRSSSEKPVETPKSPDAKPAGGGEKLLDEGAKKINRKSTEKDAVAKSEELEAA